jgi:hypothetical protein
VGEQPDQLLRRAARLTDLLQRRLDESALVPNARLASATLLWEWICTDDAAAFSY